MTAPGPTPGSGHGRLPLAGTDLLLVLILALGGSRFLLPVLAQLFGLGPIDPGAQTGLVLLLLTVQSAILFLAVYLVAVRWRGATWGDLGFHPLPAPWPARALLTALLAFPAVSAVSWLQMQITGQPLDNPQMQVLAPAGFSWSRYLGLLLVAAVVAPVVEEVAFRGLLYRWLRERAGPIVGAGASALAFSLLHGIAGLIPAIFVLGVILAWIYERTGSIWAPILVHGVYNGIVTTIVYAALARGIEVPGAGQGLLGP